MTERPPSHEAFERQAIEHWAKIFQEKEPQKWSNMKEIYRLEDRTDLGRQLGLTSIQQTGVRHEIFEWSRLARRIAGISEQEWEQYLEYRES